MDKLPNDRASELLASIAEQSQKTAEQVAELRAVAADLRRQADEIDQALRTITGIGSTATGNANYRKGTISDLLHSHSECPAGECFWCSDAC